MFCSNCGKTIKPDDKVCAHCGAALGDSRFEGSGYTSVQTRHVPGEQPKSERYTPYTRTTYMSEVEDDGDVYARTSYRPVLKDDPEPAAEPEPEKDEPADDEEGYTKINTDTPDAHAPAGEDSSSIEDEELVSDVASAVEPTAEIESKKTPTTKLKPVKVAGISPEVAAYAERLKEQKGKPKRSLLSTIGIRRDEDATAEVDPDDVQPDDDNDDQTEQADYVPRPRSNKRIGRIVGMAVGALAILVLLVGGFIFISSMTAPSARIEGVTLSVYEKGLDLVQAHTLTDYKRSVAQLYLNDSMNSTTTAEAKLNDDMDEITKLYSAEKPMTNDQLFVNVLTRIQTDIADAISRETVGEIAQNDAMLASAQEVWDRVNASILNLKNATTADELRTILSDTSAILATPEPEASPTPAIYKTLTKGEKSVAVQKMQARLKELGFYNGDVDGDFGSVTQTRVKQFQQAIGMEADGIATPEFQERLYADDAPVASPSTNDDGTGGQALLVDENGNPIDQPDNQPDDQPEAGDGQ